MTAFATFREGYNAILMGEMKARKDWLSRLTTDGIVPADAEKGDVNIAFVADPTVSTPAEGTIVGGGSDITAVAGTLTSRVASLSLSPNAMKSRITRKGGIAKIASKHGDKLFQAVQNTIIAALKAKVPIHSETLPVGQIDFLCPSGTDAQVYNVIKAMERCIARLSANFTNMNPQKDFSIVMPPDAYAYFITARIMGVRQVMQGPDGLYYFNGIPVFSLTGATNFGGAGNECAFITHRESAICAFQDPYLENGGPFSPGDQHVRWNTILPFATGVVGPNGSSQYFFAEVVNPAS
jgi:hypothetical protein